MSAAICKKIFKRSFIHTHQKDQRHLFSAWKIFCFLIYFTPASQIVPLIFYPHISLVNQWTKYAKLKHTVRKDSEKMFICHVSVLLIPKIQRLQINKYRPNDDMHFSFHNISVSFVAASSSMVKDSRVFPHIRFQPILLGRGTSIMAL